MIGAWIEGEAAVSERRSHEFHVVLGQRGLSIWDEEDRRGGWIEFAKAVPLINLTVHETLQEQEEMVGAICVSALRALVAPAD